MAGEYEKAITIEKAINQIVNRRYLLPAIQRKFTWSSSQICVLFDSIMRGYPINTFMFWESTWADVGQFRKIISEFPQPQPLSPPSAILRVRIKQPPSTWDIFTIQPATAVIST
nr:DUF262 domain-containing protein [Desulfuromonas thiophila]